MDSAPKTRPIRKPHPKTLADIFYAIIERGSDRIMLTREASGWQNIGARDLYKYAVGVGKALQSWGVQRGDRVAILSENRPEWAIADFATLLVGACVVPIYATLTADQCLYVLRHSGARVVFCSTAAQMEKVQSIQAQTAVEHIVLMDAQSQSPVKSHDMQKIAMTGPDERDLVFDAAAHTVSPADLCTIIYTSGTTGTPKGVMLTHGNLAANLDCSLEAFEFVPDAGDISISFLPLSHVTARHLDYAMFHHGVTLAYCPDINKLPQVLEEIRPTVFVAVPRVYEKIYNQVQKEVGKGTKRSIYNWALQVGRANMSTVLAGKTPTAPLWRVANRLVFSRIVARMGNRVRIFISGGAPLGRELGEWYAWVGIRINEGYGLTETSPVIALNNPGAYKLGTVGRVLPNIEVKIAEDGEILVKGPSVFSGYWNMPDETRNAFEDGWFKTGDVGMIDPDGFLIITDRKKDLLKTSGGKFIAPQPIESSLKANPLISEAAVIGERRRFPAVVIAPSFPVLRDWAVENNLIFTSDADLVRHPYVKELYQGIVDQVNRNLAQFEKLKKVLVLPEELSVEHGTLTPTLKLRRRKVEERYREMIEKMYAESEKEAVSALKE
ncbi:MAG TPA: long-chain fatty acid--CoA ligase [Terriglobales bacterium]|nr:long-chain fatty acid--CoA ligase [Terriglobales bacterium]